MNEHLKQYYDELTRAETLRELARTNESYQSITHTIMAVETQLGYLREQLQAEDESRIYLMGRLGVTQRLADPHWD